MKEINDLRKSFDKERKRLNHRLYMMQFDWVDRPIQSVAVGQEWVDFKDDERRAWHMRDITPPGTREVIQQFYCDAGVLIPLHKHPDADEVIIVVSGVLHLDMLNQGKRTMTPFDAQHIPAGEIHGGVYPVASHCILILTPTKNV